jgi:hypothetical protein
MTGLFTKSRIGKLWAATAAGCAAVEADHGSLNIDGSAGLNRVRYSSTLQGKKIVS